MHNAVNRATAVLMLIFISVMSVMLFFGHKDKRSERENRELAVLPDVGLSAMRDGSFAKDLEHYTADHFPLRDKLIAWDASIEAQISERIVNGVYITGDRLIDTGASDRESADRSAEAINRFRENYSGAVYFVCVPTSSGVYAESLPPYMQKNTESRQITALYSSLSQDIRRVDAYNILKMLNENYVFYRTDTKWTSYGAYCVYRTVIQKLGFSPTAYDKYTIDHVTDGFRGDLYNRSQYSGVKPDIMDIYRCSGGAEVLGCVGSDEQGNTYERQLYDKNRLDSDYKYDMYMGAPLPLVKLTTSVNNERKLLVITDDFGACFVPFLTQHYSEIDVVRPSEMSGQMSSIIDPDKYEQVLFLFGIDSMSDSTIFEKLG